MISAAPGRELGATSDVRGRAAERPAARPRVLVIDDERSIRELLSRLLLSAGYACETVGEPAAAREMLVRSSFDLLLCDVNLPEQSGLELVRHVLAERDDVAAVMVSGFDDPTLARLALDYGAYGYLLKPFTPHAVLIAVTNALRRRDVELKHREQTETLEQQVVERTRSLQSALDRLENTARQLESSREETIRVLSRAVEYRNADTGTHIERMSRYCGVVARRLGLDPHPIEVASPMHDVGKIAVPDEILLKQGKLTSYERAVMQRHTVVGHELLRDSESALLKLAAVIAWTHHERYDGSGYPRGVAAEEIPLEGRIAAVADVFDALTSDRPYRAAMSVEDALAVMMRERGLHFDPFVLDTFIGSLPEIEAIRQSPQPATPSFETAAASCP